AAVALVDVGDVPGLDVHGHAVDVAHAGHRHQPLQVALGVDQRGQVPAHHPQPSVVGPVDDGLEQVGIGQVAGGVVLGGLDVERLHPGRGHAVHVVRARAGLAVGVARAPVVHVQPRPQADVGG